MKSPNLAFPKNAISILDLAEFGFCEVIDNTSRFSCMISEKRNESNV